MVFIEFIIEKSKLIGLLVIIAIILHGTLGKPRWQYYPLYFLALLYFFLVIFSYSETSDLSSSMTKWIIAIGFFLIFISVVFILALPLEELPMPSGEFEIGTRTYDLEDKSRNEIYSKDKDDKRKIKYQIWYPTEKTLGYKKAKWISDGKVLTRHLAKSMHLPAFMLDHTAQINSNSYYEAPLNSSLDKYPVVIISHGWKGFRELHADYAEELASNGFIAISIDHTYGSEAVKFKDGSISYLNKEALPNEVDPSKYNENSNKLVKTYGEDVATVIDDLERMNNKDEDFKDRLDLESLGVLGHSTGGGGEVYISLVDERIKALLGLDAWVNPIESEKLEQGFSIPSLFLRSEQWSKGPNNKGLNTIIKNSDNANLIQLNKTNHVDFSMSYMYSPLTKYIGFTGELGGRKSSDIQREFILNFFDKSLRSKDAYNEDYLIEIVDKYSVAEIID